MVIYPGQSLELDLACCPEVYIESYIDSGGSGSVYKVKDVRTGRYYAFKHIRIKNNKNLENNRKLEKIIDCAFMLGKEVSLSFDSPYITKNYGLVRLDELEFGILCEYIEGDHLREWLEKNPSNSWDEKKEIFIKILEGVKAIHQKGIIHHDLKPQNILITKGNAPKILDFGLAKIIDKDISSNNDFKGTLPYIAPENFAGIKTTRQFDIFSLGSILYELYRNKNYLEICNYERPPLEKMLEQQNSNLVLKDGSILDLDNDFPLESEADKKIAVWIKKSTAFYPANRYKTVEHFLQDIKPYVTIPIPSNSFIAEKKDTEDNLPTSSSKHFKTPFFIMLVLFLISLFSLGMLFDAYDSNTQENKRLRGYEGLYSNQLQENQSLQTKNDDLQDKIKQMKNKVKETTFYIGEKISDEEGEYDSGWKLFFQANKSIMLNSVMVRAKNPGSIKIMMCDLSGKIVRETQYFYLGYSQLWHRVDLDFRVIPGLYYLAFEGDSDMKLFYSSKDLEYPYEIPSLMKITGSDSGDNYENQKYYQYFYEWQVSLLLD